ncbi:MAG: phosphopantetheine-binding protein [Rubrivivax sp.]|nr:phosphopantetheine-binding protein [Rubrivivax sp.]
MGTDALTDEILDVFAREARVDRSKLLEGARADELGITSLDLALALFEIEDRFEVQLPQPQPGMPWPTVGEMVQLVREGIERRRTVQALG